MESAPWRSSQLPHPPSTLLHLSPDPPPLAASPPTLCIRELSMTGLQAVDRKFLAAQKQPKHPTAAQQVVSSLSLESSVRGEHSGAGHWGKGCEPGYKWDTLASTSDSVMETIILKLPYNFAEP